MAYSFIVISALLFDTTISQYASMSCYSDQSYINSWDYHHDNVQSVYFMNGVEESVHSNYKEDRRWRWRYCYEESPGFISKFSMDSTPYDDTWYRDCATYNTHSAMIGGTSDHSNNKEDRVWTWYCGELDTSKWMLTDCSDTGYVNSWDGTFQYYCPNNGVIRKIYSTHDNGKEDRLWGFICCNVMYTPCFDQGPCDDGYMDKTDGNYRYWACGINCEGGTYYTDGGCNCACTSDTTCNPTPSPTSPSHAPTPAPTDPSKTPTKTPTEAPTVFYEFACVTRTSVATSTSNQTSVGCMDDEVLLSCGYSTVSVTGNTHPGSFIKNSKVNGEAELCVANKLNDGDDVLAHARCCSFTDLVPDISCVGYDRGVLIDGADDVRQTVSCSETMYPYITGCSVYSPKDTDDGAWANDAERGDVFADGFGIDYPMTEQRCTVRDGWETGGSMATLTCCQSPTYDLNCVTRWADFDSSTKMSVVTCSDGYIMTGCSAESVYPVANAWYISDDDECIARSESTATLYAVAICCRLDTDAPTATPTKAPTSRPTKAPTPAPTNVPTSTPTSSPTEIPTDYPTGDPTIDPTSDPTLDPSTNPTKDPTIDPSMDPTKYPTVDPTVDPTNDPTSDPSSQPTMIPTSTPSSAPTSPPTRVPSSPPTASPSGSPTTPPTLAPTPLCPVLLITVMDSVAIADYFNGMYTFHNSGQVNDRPAWKVPQIPTDRNIQYDNNSHWIINGDGDEVLSYASNSLYPPDDETTQWSHITEGMVTVHIKCVTTFSPIAAPTSAPTIPPTVAPTVPPTLAPSISPTHSPSTAPTYIPTTDPTIDPTIDPTVDPTHDPTIDPTNNPTHDPTIHPTKDPTSDPTIDPTIDPTSNPTLEPTLDPSTDPTAAPTSTPTLAPTISPTYSPTTAPSYAPTAYCPVLDVTVIDADGVFNPDSFDGLYTMIPEKESFQRPWWEVPQSGNDRNIHYTGHDWIIEGENHGILSYYSSSKFPPIHDFKAEWVLSTVPNTFHINIHCVATYAPSNAPTSAPTVTPTSVTKTPTTAEPSPAPTRLTIYPTLSPTTTIAPTGYPSSDPTLEPTIQNVNIGVQSTMSQAGQGQVIGSVRNIPVMKILWGLIGFVSVIICIICLCFCLRKRRKESGFSGGAKTEPPGVSDDLMLEMNEGVSANVTVTELTGATPILGHGGTTNLVLPELPPEKRGEKSSSMSGFYGEGLGSSTKLGAAMTMLTSKFSSQSQGISVRDASDDDDDEDDEDEDHAIDDNGEEQEDFRTNSDNDEEEDILLDLARNNKDTIN